MGKTVQVAALVNYLTQEYAKQGYSFNVLYLTEKNLIKQSSEELIRFSGEYFHTLQGEKPKIAKFSNEFELTKVNICGSHSLIKHPDFHKWCNSFEEHYGEGEFPFDMIVIDESGAIITSEKNGYFESGKVLVDKVPYVICMNGGPFENHLDKFRTQIEFIDSTLLFNKTEFNKRYQIMDWYGGRPTFSGKYQNAEDFKEKLIKRNRFEFDDKEELEAMVGKIVGYLEQDQVKHTICHGDCYSPNFLVDEEGNMSLIDWEYSGMGDPTSDIGTFVACSDYTLEQAKEFIRIYLEHNPGVASERHFLGIIGLVSYYWFLWALFQESNGKPVGEFLYKWYRYTKQYCTEALRLYEEEK